MIRQPPLCGDDVITCVYVCLLPLLVYTNNIRNKEVIIIGI